jgi:hypothetical protein
MYKKLLSSLLAITFLIACNNSANNSGTDNDTANKMNSDMMSNMGSTSVPELPAVPAGAKVFFKNLKNNQTVTSPVTVQMGVENMKVDTSGPVLQESGHFHIFIDAEDSLAAGTVVPKDSTHLHYGNAQTQATVALSPGKHKLTLQFADGLHRSYGSQMAATLNINVKK